MSLQVLTKGFEDGYYQHLINLKNEAGGKIPALDTFEKDCEKQGVVPADRVIENSEKYWLSYLEVQPWEYKRAKKVRDYARKRAILAEVFEGHKTPLEESTMEKAFSVTPLQVIFPIFYDTMIMAGLLAEPLLDLLVMRTITDNVGTFDHASMNESLTDRQMGESGEWATYSELYISATNAPVKTRKFGGILNVSDEAVRRARIPVYSYGVERIGRQLAIDLTDFAIDTIINGDGTTLNGAATTVASPAANAPTFADYVKLLYTFPIQYKPTDIIMSKNTLQRMQEIPQFADPWAFNMSDVFQATGNLSTPFGLRPHRWDSTGSSTYGNGTTTALDNVIPFQKDRCLIMYQEGGLMSETDRVLNGSFTRTATNIYVTFGIWDRSAAVVGQSF